MSLANKCLLLFSGAAVVIVLAALSGPWLRMSALIDAGQLEMSRQLVSTWESNQPALGPVPAFSPPWTAPLPAPAPTPGQIDARRIDAAVVRASDDRFLVRALELFEGEPTRADYQQARWNGLDREYRYAKPARRLEGDGTRVVGVVELSRRSVSAGPLLLTNTAYVLVSGAFVLLLALAVFWLITRTLILRPVAELQRATERVRQGNFSARAELSTGDEFEDLARTLNTTLNDLQASQDRLRAINAALDVKLHELEETNRNLYHAAKVKGEFLASVSHELRTPLNSIIGFAELLLDMVRIDSDSPSPPPTVVKRKRYLENIHTAGKNLLALINSLLEMARIEAGKVDLRIERMHVRDACEGLLALIQPLADRKGVSLTLDVADDVPVLRTDARKVQQIVFNFLSNAVKFSLPLERTGREPTITLRAERLPAATADGADRIRISVIDNGPGIPREEQERIFEKFVQLEGGIAREQSGTGLGLAISKDLAQIVGGEIQLVSNLGQGSMFSLILPLTLEAAEEPASAGAPSGATAAD